MKDLKAAEPRDKVYAMLWAFPNCSLGSDASCQADYSKSIDEIYTEFSTAVLAQSNYAPDQFYLVNGSRRASSLPSWVPDWNEPDPMALTLWTQNLKAFHAAGSESMVCKIECKGRNLHIWGIEHSKITRVVELCSEANWTSLTESPDLEKLQQAFVMAARQLKSLIEVIDETFEPDTQIIAEHLYHLIYSRQNSSSQGPSYKAALGPKAEEMEIAHRLKIEVGILRLTIFIKLSAIASDTTLKPNVVEAILDPYLAPEESSHVLRQAERKPALHPFFAILAALSGFVDVQRLLATALAGHHDKSFFLTNSGHLGVAFRGVAAGDAVAVWQGCPSPMVVRPDAAGLYRLHGPAHVDGIMDGEAWSGREDELRVFELV